MILKVFKNNSLVVSYEVLSDKFVLGRDANCEITIDDDNIPLRFIEFKIKDEALQYKKISFFGEILKNGKSADEEIILDKDKLEFSDYSLSFERKVVKDSDIDDFSIIKEPELPEVHEVIKDIDDEKNEEIKNTEDSLSIEKTDDTEDKDSEESEIEDKEKDKNKEDKKEDESKEDKKPEDKKEEIREGTIVSPGLLVYQLITLSGPYKDKIFSLDKDQLSVGRSKENEIVLVDDLVSRKHARFYKQGLEYYVEDLGSGNGVKVNGKKITKPMALLSADVVEIGNSSFRFMAINPNLQDVVGINKPKEETKSVQKIYKDEEIEKIEKSYGFGKVKTNKKNLIIIGALIFGLVLFFVYLGSEEEAPVAPKEEVVEEVVEEVEKADCAEESLCHLPLGVQRQLLSEYDIGVRLYKNYQFELAEDRAVQILSKAPQWPKAMELLNLAREQKERLIVEKKKEEEAEIRKMLEEKISGLLEKARAEMKKNNYKKVEELVSEIFEHDPGNEEAKKMIDKINEYYEKQKKIEQDRISYRNSLERYKDILSKGKALYRNKELVKAIEVFSTCVKIPYINSSDFKKIQNECISLIDSSRELLREAITPELAVAEEMFVSGQYREAIDSYGRVLKIDYKNDLAKKRINEAKNLLTEEAKERYARGAVSESISDITQACLLYNSVIQIAVPGTRYYRLAMEKAKKLGCSN